MMLQTRLLHFQNLQTTTASLICCFEATAKQQGIYSYVIILRTKRLNLQDSKPPPRHCQIPPPQVHVTITGKAWHLIKSSNRISSRSFSRSFSSAVRTQTRKPRNFLPSPHEMLSARQASPTTPHLSSLRHWKWMEDRSSNTPVLSGSCLHSCMQWRSAASKSPDWYSRCASSANPWKESKRFVGSGAPTQAEEGGKQHVRLDGRNEIWQMKTNRWQSFH